MQKPARAGRPRLGEAKLVVGYQIQAQLKPNQAEIDKALNSKGRFILATNDLDTEHDPDAQLLSDYKEQQVIERGFRFLKNPEFGADTLFLKSPARIMALMRVMTLCLFVYNVTQLQLRQQLRAHEEVVPNQVGKTTSQPTLRWIFQLMEDISLVLILDATKQLIHRITSNLTEVRQRIIPLIGPSAQKIHGLAVSNSGMWDQRVSFCLKGIAIANQ